MSEIPTSPDQDRFRALFEQARDAILIADDDGTYVDANAAATKLLGYPREELIGKRISEIMVDDPQAAFARMWRKFRDDRWMYGAIRLRRKDGAVRLFEFNAAAEFVPGLHLSILRDVTDRRPDAGQNEEAQALREEFVAAITHDLRSPLTTIRLNADLLANTPGLPKSVLDFGQRISRQVGRAERLITDVLDVSRIRAGRPLLVRRRSMDLEPVLLAWVEELEPLYKNPLRCHTAGATLGEWDPAALRRAFENLVANAAKYGAANGPIDVTLVRQDGEVVLSVRNEGNPLRPQEMQGIFHPFSRVDEGAAQQGWGLGLTIVRAVAEAHGGRVTLESSAEAGTTFALVFPLPQARCLGPAEAPGGN